MNIGTFRINSVVVEVRPLAGGRAFGHISEIAGKFLAMHKLKNLGTYDTEAEAVAAIMRDHKKRDVYAS